MSALKTRYRIEGMDCAGCATKIDTAVRRIDGVAEVSVSVTAGTMTVEHDGADLAVLEKRVSGLGYGIALLPAAATPSVAPALPEAKAHDHAHDSCCAGHDHDHAHGHEHDDCRGHDHDHAHDHRPRA